MKRYGLSLPILAALSLTSAQGSGAAAPDASAPSVLPQASASTQPSAAPAATEVPVARLETFQAEDGVYLHVTPPAGWVSQKADKKFLDPSEIAGGAVTSIGLWAPPASGPGKKAETDARFLWIACVSAPSTEWAPGMESIVFERMTVIAKAEIAKRVHLETFDPSPYETRGQLMVQSYTFVAEPGIDQHEGSVRVLAAGKGDETTPHVRGHGAHTIGFSSKLPRVFACTTLCADVEPALSAKCSNVILGQSIDGELAEEPSPTLIPRVMMAVRAHTAAAVGVMLGLLLALVGGACLVRGTLMAKQTRGGPAVRSR